MAMEALGRVYNAVMPADDVYVNLEDYGGVEFHVFEVDGATSATITFSNNAAGGSTSTPDVIDHFYQRSNDQASGVWVEVAVSPASETFTPSDTTGDHAVAYIDASMCPDGKPYVKCTADGSATVTAILVDPHSQRGPVRLASVTA